MVVAAQVLKQLLGNLPSWLSRPDFERAESLNRLLQSMWPHMSSFIVANMRKAVQQELDAHRPSFLSACGLGAVSIGTIAPTISAVKVYESRGEDCIRFDLDFAYSGNSEVGAICGCFSTD